MGNADFPIGEALPDPLFVISKGERTLIWMNGAAEIWMGRSRASLQGRAFAKLAPGFEKIAKLVGKDGGVQTLIKGDGVQIQTQISSSYYCSYRIFPCPIGTAVLISSYDTGATQINTKRNEAVNMFGKMLAHELKNPLAGIRGAAQLLQGELESKDDLDLAELIISEVDRMGRLAETMENFGTATPENAKFFNIHAVLRRVKLLFESQNHTGVNLVEDYDPSLPEVFGDEDALVQAVLNLVGNALEAMSKSGKGNAITLRTVFQSGYNKRNEQGILCALPIGIGIVDNGPGVSAGIQSRIFEPFITSKSNGHGLGLALVAQIIDDFGGLIDVETRPGKTEFLLMLPIKNNMRNGT